MQIESQRVIDISIERYREIGTEREREREREKEREMKRV